MKPRLLVIGAGGHARVVISIARRTESWEVAGILAREMPAQPELIDGVPIIGTYAEAARLLAEGWQHAALAIGDNAERAAHGASLTALGFALPVLRHPTALVEYNASVGDGSVVCAGAILGAEVKVGRGAIVNTGTILDHETQVGDYAHVAPGCRVAGRVSIGDGAMIGIGSSVREKIKIGAQALVGAGSVVVADVPAGVVAYGVPARVARPRTP